MAYSELTIVGKEFITYVCEAGMIANKYGNTLLKGKNRYPFPFSYVPANTKIWTCNIKIPTDTTKTITTASELANALIYWFNYYSMMYEIDANVIAAQAYIESHYIIWNYAGADTQKNIGSTASGVNQFTMDTIYGVILNNGYNVEPKMTPAEIGAINAGLTDKTIDSSYMVGGNTNAPTPSHETAWKNRPILHQNVIDNPGIMIKAQCRYMKYIANKCNSLTSTALFGYSRGPAYALDTYTKSIQACAKNASSDYLQEGLNYVLLIFGVLGDKENWLTKNGQISYTYKPNGKYFGYDETKDKSGKNLKLKQNFNVNAANVSQSSIYNV
jgi:hypothetical protein